MPRRNLLLELWVDEPSDVWTCADCGEVPFEETYESESGGRGHMRKEGSPPTYSCWKTVTKSTRETVGWTATCAACGHVIRHDAPPPMVVIRVNKPELDDEIVERLRAFRDQVRSPILVHTVDTEVKSPSHLEELVLEHLRVCDKTRR